MVLQLPAHGEYNPKVHYLDKTTCRLSVCALLSTLKLICGAMSWISLEEIFLDIDFLSLANEVQLCEVQYFCKDEPLLFSPNFSCCHFQSIHSSRSTKYLLVFKQHV